MDVAAYPTHFSGSPTPLSSKDGTDNMTVIRMGHNLGRYRIGRANGLALFFYARMNTLNESSVTEVTTENQIPAKTGSALTPSEQFYQSLAPLLENVGYELVHLETVNNREKTLRIFIDVLGAREDKIGVEDCAIVSRALDEPLENMKEVDAYFGGAYELEVSSPGVDRPLRKARDFEKFAGRDIRLNTLRPLTSEEIGNADYHSRNPKQKNFIGILGGMEPGKNSVKLTVLASMGAAAKSKKTSKKPEKKDEILIPISLIQKANIEPDFDFAE